MGSPGAPTHLESRLQRGGWNCTASVWLFPSHVATVLELRYTHIGTRDSQPAIGSRAITPFIERLLPAPVGGGFMQDDHWVWCGSAIRGEDARFHLFAARWPKALPFFAGYLTHSEVVRAVADTPEGPYAFQEVVLPARGSEHWDGQMTHNPTIHRVGDTYLLYYIGATYAGEKPEAAEVQRLGRRLPQCQECYPNIRIGLATASSVYGPWTRAEAPILRTRPGKWDSSVVTNPAPCVRDDGSVLLYYRSNTPEGMRLGLAGAEHYAGPYRRLAEDPVLRFDAGEVEDPFVWWNGDQYELIAKDMRGEICGEDGAGVHAHSGDGMAWALSDPPKAYSRRVRWGDGTVTEQGALERPQLLLQEGRPTHLFAAAGDGPGGFDHCTRTWNLVIPLASQ